MQPTSNPITTEVDFMIGEPNRSQRMMATKTENPKPRNSADPQGRGWGALMLGHSANNPSVAVIQPPLPPIQLEKPDLMSLIPMSMTVGPVTMGGSTRSRNLAGMKETRILTRAHTAEVPRMAPYPSGQGKGFPSESEGQKPLAYIWARLPWATGITLKETPTTDNTPVPR